MKTKLYSLCVCVLALCAIALVACAAPAPTPTPVPPTPVPTPDPAAVIKAMAAALNAGNVDAVMVFYADDAILTQQPAPAGQSGVWTGKEQIRVVIQNLVAGNFSGEVSNLKVVGDKITLTGTLSTDTYRKLGVAPIVIAEETVIVGGKIKSQTHTVTPESLAKIQAAMAAQAKAATPKKVLLVAREKSPVMELMLTKEVGVMITLLEQAGLKVVVASLSGQPITEGAATLKPDLKLAEVKVEDYAGFIFPCMAGDGAFPEAVEVAKKAAALGKPIAAQNGSVLLTLAPAGLLNGKQFAVFPGFEKLVPNGIYKGAGVVQDGNVITSGSCPFAGRDGKYPDTTTELTQQFIALLGAAR